MYTQNGTQIFISITRIRNDELAWMNIMFWNDYPIERLHLFIEELTNKDGSRVVVNCKVVCKEAVPVCIVSIGRFTYLWSYDQTLFEHARCRVCVIYVENCAPHFEYKFLIGRKGVVLYVIQFGFYLVITIS